MASPVTDDVEVGRLLHELRQYQPRSENPAAEVKEVWRELHLAWWRASVSAASRDGVVDKADVLNWPAWIQSQATPASVDLFLHWVYDEEFTAIVSNTATKDNPYPRMQTIADRLGLAGRGGTPWLMFLHFGYDILSSTRLMKEFSAWIGRLRSLQPVEILCMINDEAVRRHGTQNTGHPPQITRQDLRAVMEDYEERTVPPDEVDSGRGTATPAPSSASLSASPEPRQRPLKRQRKAGVQNYNRQGGGRRRRNELMVEETNGRVDTPERGRQASYNGLIDPDLSPGLGSWHRMSSASAAGDPNRQQEYVNVLESLHRIGGGAFADPNLRAVTDSIIELASVALRMIGTVSGGEQE